jgi:hypothetical protein
VGEKGDEAKENTTVVKSEMVAMANSFLYGPIY